VNDKGFTIWFWFCGLMALLVFGGAVYAMVELWPHLIGMLDRVGK
jgi:hypothetical protein